MDKSDIVNRNFRILYFTGTGNQEFKTKAMGMSRLLSGINEFRQSTEALLRTAAQRMEATESAIEAQLRNEGSLFQGQKKEANDYSSGPRDCATAARPSRTLPAASPITVALCR